MLNWEIINKMNVSVRCADEKETIQFLQECEKKGIPWKSGIKATESSTCYRTISTNGGQFLTSYERPGEEIVEFQSMYFISDEERMQEEVKELVKFKEVLEGLRCPDEFTYTKVIEMLEHVNKQLELYNNAM